MTTAEGNPALTPENVCSAPASVASPQSQPDEGKLSAASQCCLWVTQTCSCTYREPETVCMHLACSNPNVFILQFISSLLLLNSFLLSPP